MTEDDYSLGEGDRRQANIMRMGTVSQVDAANGLVRVDLGDLVTDWLPWTTPRAGQDRIWSTPDTGEQVVVLSPGEPSQGVVIGSLFQNSSPANGSDGKDRRITFKDGTVVEMDREGSALNVQVNPAGSLRLNIGATTLLLQDGQATLTTPQLVVDSPQSIFTGAVTVQGLLTYLAGLVGSGGGGASITGGVAIIGGSVTHNGTNIGSDHSHSGVQPGGGSTGTPN